MIKKFYSALALLLCFTMLLPSVAFAQAPMLEEPNEEVEWVGYIETVDEYGTVREFYDAEGQIVAIEIFFRNDYDGKYQQIAPLNQTLRRTLHGVHAWAWHRDLDWSGQPTIGDIRMDITFEAVFQGNSARFTYVRISNVRGSTWPHFHSFSRTNNDRVTTIFLGSGTSANPINTRLEFTLAQSFDMFISGVATNWNPWSPNAVFTTIPISN